MSNPCRQRRVILHALHHNNQTSLLCTVSMPRSIVARLSISCGFAYHFSLLSLPLTFVSLMSAPCRSFFPQFVGCQTCTSHLHIISLFVPPRM